MKMGFFFKKRKSKDFHVSRRHLGKSKLRKRKVACFPSVKRKATL